MKLIKKIKKGFTLVELVVTIAIIAILSGASVATYFGVTENARKTNAENTATQIASVLRVEATAAQGNLSIGEEANGDRYLAVTPNNESDTDIAVVIAFLGTQGITVTTTELTEAGDATDSKITVLTYKTGSYTHTIHCENNFALDTTSSSTTTSTDSPSN